MAGGIAEVSAMIDKPRDDPAFPFNRTEAECYSGTKLRDYIATQALAGYTASDVGEAYPGPSGGTVDEWRASLMALAAKYCYGLADAMLAERDK
jgi:hypothetical protein